MAVDKLIEKAGGIDAVTKLTGVGYEAVRKWRQSGSIPAKHWSVLLNIPSITLADLNIMTHEAPSMTSQTAPLPPSQEAQPEGATALLVLSDGSLFWGRGFGAHNKGVIGELCFCTGMTGYQETLTDPSFAEQIVTFTFPHIGNVGTNPEDDEAPHMAALGAVVKEDITEPASWRAHQSLDSWLKKHHKTGISGIDTRAITRIIRDKGPQAALLFYPEKNTINPQELLEKLQKWDELEGVDLASRVAQNARHWTQNIWQAKHPEKAQKHRVVALDYGAKDNILRCLVAAGCDVHVLPGTAAGEEILALKPEGVFLSNGPGDPAATAQYAVPAIKSVLEANIPIFGICLGHQLLAQALGGKTYKLAQGHRGANQPVKDLITGKVEITSQNHGFAVDEKSLPKDVEITHISLFDGSNEGISSKVKDAFSVQYHPEASPGPTDSFYLFERFVKIMEQRAATQNQTGKGA